MMKFRISSVLLFVITLLMFFIASTVSAQNWPMLNFNKERTSWASDETILYPPLEKKNEILVKSTGNYIRTQYLTFYDNVLALGIGRYPNTLEMVDIASGDTLWTFEVPEALASMNFTCAQNDSMVFAGGQKGLGLYVLDKETGEQKWNKQIGSLFTKSIMLDNNYAYILGDSLYCLSVEDGATVWSYPIKVQTTPAIDESYVYVVGNYEILIFDKINGELLWSKSNSQKDFGAIAVDNDCFYTFSNDTIFSYNKEIRDIKWNYVSPGNVINVTGQNSFAISNDKLCFIVENDGNEQTGLITLNKGNGEFLWNHTFPSIWIYAPTIVNGIVYIVSGEGNLYGFDLEDGTKKFYNNSYFYKYQPIVANHELYVAIDSGAVALGNIETKVDEFNSSFSQDYTLMQNYPNPFNLETTIKFFLPQNEFVNLKIYNNLGEEMYTLINEKRASGLHSIVFDSSNLSGGLYFYKITAGSFKSANNLLLIK